MPAPSPLAVMLSDLNAARSSVDALRTSLATMAGALGLSADAIKRNTGEDGDDPTRAARVDVMLAAVKQAHGAATLRLQALGIVQSSTLATAPVSEPQHDADVLLVAAEIVDANDKRPAAQDVVVFLQQAAAMLRARPAPVLTLADMIGGRG